MAALLDAETRAAAAEAIRKDLEERLADAEARASLAEGKVRSLTDEVEHLRYVVEAAR